MVDSKPIILSGNNPKEQVGLPVREFLGTPILLLPTEIKDPTNLTPEQKETITELTENEYENRISDIQGLRVGDTIFFRSITGGWAISTVTEVIPDFKKASAENEYNLHPLRFENERECWVCIGSINKKCLNRLQLK